MTLVTTNLGLVRAIQSGTTAPSNIKMLWYNENVGENRLYYYDTAISTWVPLTTGEIITPSTKTGDYFSYDKTFRHLPITGTSNFFFYKDTFPATSYDKIKTIPSTGIVQTMTSGVDYPPLTNGDNTAAAGATESTYPGVLFIQPGLVSVYFTAKKTVGTKVVKVYAKIYKTNSSLTSPVLLTTCEFTEALTNSDVNYLINGVISQGVSCATTDRLAVEIIAQVSGSGTTPVIVVSMEGSTFTRLEVPASIIKTSSTSGGGYTEVQNITPTNGQTIFTLDNSVPAGLQPIVSISGIIFEQGVDYTISGTTLTWINSVTLDTSDTLSVYYSM